MEHSPEFYALIKKRPTAYILFSILVDRARKSEIKISDGLDLGEAMTGSGDASLYRVGRQIYRNDLKALADLKLITCRKSTSKKTGKSTNEGTIVRIVNTSIFNIDRKTSTNDSTNDSTNGQPTINQRLTTKQERERLEGNILLTEKDEKPSIIENEKFVTVKSLFKELTGQNPTYSQKDKGAILSLIESKPVNECRDVIVKAWASPFWNGKGVRRGGEVQKFEGKLFGYIFRSQEHFDTMENLPSPQSIDKDRPVFLSRAQADLEEAERFRLAREALEKSKAQK